MKLVESILTKNPCYTAGKKITVKGLMLHSVGCPQPRAQAFISNWNSPSYDRACVHGFIDGNDGTVYQTLPWDHRGWHAGGSANNTHIGVEMCEPACIKYTKGATFTCSDMGAAIAVAKRTYEAAVELFAMLCVEFRLDPLGDGVIISHSEGCKRGIASDHADPEHLWKQLGLEYTMKGFRNDVAVKAAMSSKGLQAIQFTNMTEAQVIAKIGPLFTADQRTSGVLASISCAQFILESGYGKSELAKNANNVFGMKTSLSGNTWSGSTWNGVSKYTKETQEEYTPGQLTTIKADFRKYACVEESIADHSAYLLGAKNGSKLRYAGIKGNTDYKAVAQLIKDGGYATSSSYVANLCSIIERWNLTQYDVKKETPTKPDEPKKYPDTPFLVRVIINNLNYRDKPSMEGKVKGQTGVGTFTIMEVSNGWGRLKSGAGWIWLDNPNYCTIKNSVSTAAKQEAPKKSVDELAKEVINGRWGNGAERKKRLTEAGYDYSVIQKRVNELLR